MIFLKASEGPFVMKLDRNVEPFAVGWVWRQDCDVPLYVHSSVPVLMNHARRKHNQGMCTDRVFIQTNID